MRFLAWHDSLLQESYFVAVGRAATALEYLYDMETVRSSDFVALTNFTSNEQQSVVFRYECTRRSTLIFTTIGLAARILAESIYQIFELSTSLQQVQETVSCFFSAHEIFGRSC